MVIGPLSITKGNDTNEKGKKKMKSLFWADCFDIFPEMPDKCVDHVFTSPPYNRKRNDKYDNYNDCISDYFDFLKRFAIEAMRLSKKYVFINIQKNYYNKKEVFQFIGEMAPYIVDIVIWEKSNPMPASGFNITNAYEFFIVLGDVSLKSNFTGTKNHLTTSVNSKMPKNHKAVMKKEVAEWFIEKFTRPGEWIFDPFMGVGTTGIVCIEKSRNFVGVELDFEYYSTARNMIQNVECVSC